MRSSVESERGKSNMLDMRAGFGVCGSMLNAVLVAGALVVTVACRDGLNGDGGLGESETSGGGGSGRSRHPVTGIVVPSPSEAESWKGMARIEADKRILIMPGHADAQCPAVGGSGTPGDAVANKGAKPMSTEPNRLSGHTMTDELFWAIEIAREVVNQGKANRIENIEFYDPVGSAEGADRCIKSPDNPVASWARGAAVAAEGGYALEIHLDAWGRWGSGSGLIPRIKYGPTQIDEALAREFGRYPIRYSAGRGVGGLGGPRRGVSFLEIGKLENPLEGLLRNSSTRDKTVRCTSKRIVDAIVRGLHIDQTGALRPAPGDGGAVTDCQ